MGPAIDFSLDELVGLPARYSLAMKVRFQDIDAAGIVFYPRFFEYFHDAYALCLEEGGASLARGIREGEWAAPLRRVTADYFKPLRFGDPIEVAIVGVKVHGTDVNVGYRATLDGQGAAAVGTALHAFVDPKSMRRVPSLPEVVKMALAPLVLTEIPR